jgi:AcrR family transcriptional regulator
MTKPPPTGLESEAVLDAAARCYLRFGVGKTTAADIAKEAGISRATLYRRFGSHEAIFLDLLTRESTDMVADADRHLAGLEDPVDRLLEGMVFSIGEIRRRPVHGAVFGGDAGAWAATRAIGTEALHRIGEACVRPLLGASLVGGSVSDEDMSDLVDWILRILISYAAVPGDGGRQVEDIRRQLSAWFIPAFEIRLGGTERESVRH